jgi:hypothetical protein
VSTKAGQLQFSSGEVLCARSVRAVQALIGSYGTSPAFEETRAQLAANMASTATESA